ncbi:OprO/OprP family phosphate-selective porin [Flavobacteriaceae bacterium]|jgi:phosphate-selective porin OprO/OprP|nr:OprO/OprP family phosphate-selective porin [Flavobacteriaceae bacterium]MDB4064258.1 OprO/OprP family phosphate-selective porin [Flavobacteriaceae bacterium]MDB4251749.1 OprO/OprP family phosphate-selective porin [Flavobacteriaceae bacterium]MDB9780767.1 OprO/OprP family phosphate-selective porin [Flavobacteriaceae bacterium]
MKINYVFLYTALFICMSLSSQETNAPKFGKGLFNLIGKDSSFSMNISARMQMLGTSNWDVNNGLSNPSSSLLVRRARLKFSGFAYSPKLTYKLELGLSNRDIGKASSFTNEAPKYILDAVVKWNFSGNFVLWFGQTKLPGNRERVISSGDLQQVDRSLLNSRFNIDRDMGFQLRHHFNLTDKFIVKEMFSMSQGEGRNITTGNLGGHQYTTRVELLPFGKFASKGDYRGSDLKFEPAPKLALGFTYDFNNDAVKNRSNQGSYMTTDTGFYSTNISTVFVDAMYKHKGFSVMAEYAYRDAEDAFAKNSDGTLTGDEVQVGNALNLQTGYLLSETLEISGRYTNIDWDQNITGKGNETQYTLGLSKYILGHKLKVQTDLSYLNLTGGTNELLYRLQVDIHF